MPQTRSSSVLRLLHACLLAAPLAAQAADALPARLSIAICDDENEWPPYSYFQRAGGKKTGQLTGFAVDVIHDIFTRRSVDYSIELIPWPRCMAVATIGKQYGMVLNLSYNDERARSFLFSRPYYATTSYYYYSRRNHPTGLAIASIADIKKYRVCGVQGYNYEGYGMAAGEVDQGAKNFPALISKVQLGRCALFLEKDEVMTAYAAIGKDYLADPDIGKAPIPGMKRDLFYFGVSKRFPRAEDIRQLIDEELQQMEANGKLGEFWKKASSAASKSG
jgi:polar amino acid transport system substrate-binding protein